MDDHRPVPPYSALMVEASERFLGLTKGWFWLIVIVGGFALYGWSANRKEKRKLAEYEAHQAKARQDREAKERARRAKIEAAQQRAEARRQAQEAIPKAVERLRAIDAGERLIVDGAIESSKITNWREAEKFVALWMATVGCPDAQPSPPGADKGVDVESSDFVAQVKWQEANIGRQVVQQLYGQAQSVSKQALFFSKSGYAGTAIDFASGRVALFRFSTTGTVTPINEAARKLTDRFDRMLNGQAVSKAMIAEAVAMPDPPPPDPKPRPYRPRSRYNGRRRYYRR